MKPADQHVILRYGYMESKDGNSALLTEDGFQNQIKKAIMDFQVNSSFNSWLQEKLHISLNSEIQ